MGGRHRTRLEHLKVGVAATLMTIGMMLTTYVVLQGPLARPAFISYYLVAFMFGVLTLELRRLAIVALVYAGLYSSMIVMSASLYRETTDVQRALRPTDSLGRWGGEEFLVLLPQTSCAATAAVAERVRGSIESAVVPALPAGTGATVSIGVAEHRAGETVLQTVERADQALYRAKQAGRNRVEVSA